MMNKIDLIIDALQLACHETYGLAASDCYTQALAAARELKALKPVAWMLPEYGDVLPASQADGTGIYNIPLYTAPPRKEWVGLTNEDWENTPDTGKQGCERDAKLFDWVEKTLKDKNT
jgi:hypothetical protein